MQGIIVHETKITRVFGPKDQKPGGTYSTVTPVNRFGPAPRNPIFLVFNFLRTSLLLSELHNKEVAAFNFYYD